MQNKKLSIRKIVSYLNDEESEGGGFWLPNIQRPFVWSEEQTSRLFDSIMREYPISTLLVWKTKEEVRHRKFIDNYRPDRKLTDFQVPENKRSKLLVLDGQQRLQSLFMGLRGSRDGRELYLDILSGAETAAPEDVRYRFAFRKAPGWPWIRFRDIIDVTNKIDSQIARDIAGNAPVSLTDAERETIELNVGRARKEFVNDDTITYQELDGVDNPDAYGLDDIVEIFIRANSGGTRLSKSDLLFSLLTSSWQDADREMEELLAELNANGFAYDRDVVLKACLTMLGKGARYRVDKFRDGSTKEQIVDRWKDLSDAIKAVHDFVITRTYIRSDRAMSSYQALIPVIYLRYKYKDHFEARQEDLVSYLLRTLITGAFSGSPDNLIDKLVRNIDEHQDFVLREIYGMVRTEGRSLEVTPEHILSQHYGSRGIHLLFSLWYPQANYQPTFSGNELQIDHIFPQSLLRTVKRVNPETGVHNLLRYYSKERDQIANCMLLTREENGPSRKADSTPEEWFSDKSADYLTRHCIPKNPDLWRLVRFDEFIEARKILIQEKFKCLMVRQEVEP